MKSDLKLYLERAECARDEAEAATLENVRQRCLRAASAWSEMAARIERGDKMRIENEVAKAATIGAQ